MIYRHHIAPPRAYTQFSHDIIRHPRLSSDAVCLLTWQLSLPPGARESLSRTAERANIGACAFTRAKRQLKEEGFVHERRVQGSGGHWVTQQLVSNVPLTPAEAAKILGQVPVSPQLAPSPRIPAVGEPTSPPTGGHPKRDSGENTSHHPAEPPLVTETETETGTTTDTLKAALALVAAFPRLSPDLRRIPRGMHDELARLVSRWLAAGHTATTIRTHILRGLPDDGTPVHRPGGLLRYLLRDVPDVIPAGRPPAAVAAPPGSSAHPSTEPGPRLSARLAGTRECEGDHVQPRLFRPAGDESLCPQCASHASPRPESGSPSHSAGRAQTPPTAFAPPLQ
ncbi:hypothetical protein ABT317_08305 [Streptomyces carpinensis]|uniref:Helix-turn-helix domain-containing protein n=1 Tax=Streptomyces carpinensis TaxID=66369 RepID=A0ABV1VYP1_9ACTN